VKLSFDTAALKDGYKASLANVLSTETALADADRQQLATLSDALFPLVTSMTQEILTSTNPAVQQQYLAGLGAIVAAKAAELALTAMQAQKDLIATETLRWISILATVLKAALLA
jgi:hypothetical protein